MCSTMTARNAWRQGWMIFSKNPWTWTLSDELWSDALENTNRKQILPHALFEICAASVLRKNFIRHHANFGKNRPLLSFVPPSSSSHDCPNRLHKPERPCALKKPIARTEQARSGKRQDIPVRGEFIIKPPLESDTTLDNASAIGTKRELLVKQIQHPALA